MINIASVFVAADDRLLKHLKRGPWIPLGHELGPIVKMK